MAQIWGREPVQGAFDIQDSLKQLTNIKLQQLHQRHAMKEQQGRTTLGLEALGIPKEQASQVALLPPELQSTVIKNYLQGAESAGLGQALGQLGEQPQEGLGAMSGQESPEGARPQSNNFADILKNPRLKPEHRLKIAEMQQRKELANQRVTASQQKEIDKETLPVYKEVLKAAKGVHDTEKTLTRMEKLIDSGKLSSPVFHSLLKTAAHGLFGIGVDLHFLESPESAEFTKLSNSFIKNAKNIFGSRITDNDLKAFMQTVPSLLQNDEGKHRIIHNIRVENKAAEIRKNALDEILRENRGRRPGDLESQIEERAGKQLDALAQEFSEGYKPAAEPSEFENLKGILTGKRAFLAGI